MRDTGGMDGHANGAQAALDALWRCLAEQPEGTVVTLTTDGGGVVNEDLALMDDAIADLRRYP